MPDETPEPQKPQFPNRRKEPAKVRINWVKPNPPPLPKSPGTLLIAHERERQIEKEGYTPEHDSKHPTQHFIRAAAAYVLDHVPHGFLSIRGKMINVDDIWPWEVEGYKPASIRRNLERAGALIAAALDRLIEDEYKDIKFYWLGEDTEIFACRNLDELHSYLSPVWVEGADMLAKDGSRGHFEDSKIILSEANKGEEWGDAANGSELVDIEDIGIMTLRGFAAYMGFENFPVQVSSSYT